MKTSHKHRIIRFFYGLFFIVLLFFMGYYIIGFAPAIYNSGSPTPHGTQTVPYNEHGYVVYITPIQHLLKELYGFAIIILFSGFFILRIILQAVFKVEIIKPRIPWPWSKFWPWSEMLGPEKMSSQNPKNKQF
jgi:hypothetical protein